MSTSPDHFSEKEILELSSKLKASLNPLTFDKPFVEYKKHQSNPATNWTLSGVAAAIIAIVAYAIVGQSSIAPAWSASPLKVSAANEAAILTTCALFLPQTLQSVKVPSSDRPKVHLVDLRSDYGDAVLVTGGTNPQTTRTWTCHFIKPKNSNFKAIDVNEANFGYFDVAGKVNPITTTPGGLTVTASSVERVSASVVWPGGDSVDGVKIPASRIISGEVIYGAISVEVKCPNLPLAQAAISKTGGFFSIWIPSTSAKCLVIYIDKNGKSI